MTRDLDAYLDAAKRKQEYDSDAQLAEAIGIKRSNVSRWRIRGAWPDDCHMTTICRLAGLDVMAGLLDLNVWRSSGPAREVYTRMRARLIAA